MLRRIYAVHTRWVYLLLFMIVFLAYETSIMFTFHAKEETVSHSRRTLEPKDGKVDLNVNENTASDPRQELESVLKATKRDLLISHEFHSGSQTKETQENPASPVVAQSKGYLETLLTSPKAFISKLQQFVGADIAPHETNGVHLSQRPSSLQASAFVPAAKLPSAAPSLVNHSSSHVTSSLNVSLVRPASPSPVVVIANASNSNFLHRNSSSSPVVAVAASNASHISASVGNSSLTPICPETPPDLVGMVKVNKSHQVCTCGRIF